MIFSAASSDAIATRVIPNPNHLSPLSWYKANIKKQGSPQELTVDGYEAIRDGRTVYVNAANISGDNGKSFYTNIYLLSFNQNVEQATEDIFGQLLAHWKFNTNVPPENKDYVRRDTKRLADLAEIKISLEKYKDGPGQGRYPKLASGSYLANKTISVWPSWQATLGKELGLTLPIDPDNKLGSCEGYDSITCWNQATKNFADPTPANGVFNLPDDSNVYVYTVTPDGITHTTCALMQSGYLTTLAQGACPGSNTQIVGYQVSAYNRAPVINCGLVKTPFGKPLTAYVSATDPDKDKITDWTIDPVNPVSWESWVGVGWTWSGSATGLKLETVANENMKKITAAKVGEMGDYSYRITAADSLAGGSAVCNIKITPPPLNTAKSTNCTGKPDSTVWNGPSSYTQTWKSLSGNQPAWDPANIVSSYDTASGACHYKCRDNYLWNNGACQAVCGTANDKFFPVAPTANLCKSGAPVPSILTGPGPWSWVCHGANGESPSPACTAQTTCGNGRPCEAGEDAFNCPSDCRKENQSCTGLPASGAVKNIAETITQTAEGNNNFTPSTVYEYNEESSSLACWYKCNSDNGYSRNNGVCEKLCGNGDFGTGEVCDDDKFGIENCASILGKPASGNLKCNNTCSAIDSSGCSAYCGNGVKNNIANVVNEECDNGVSNTDVTCSAPYGGSCTYCDTLCKKKTITGKKCGDGSIDGPEKCDGIIFGNQDCSTQLGVPAHNNLICTNNCTNIDSSKCVPDTCGDGTCNTNAGETASNCPGDCLRSRSGVTCDSATLPTGSVSSNSLITQTSYNGGTIWTPKAEYLDHGSGTDKCYYKCNEAAGYAWSGSVCRNNICIGGIPAYTDFCSGSDAGLTVNTPRQLVDSCGTNKCAYACKLNYSPNASYTACEPDHRTVSCTGLPAETQSEKAAWWNDADTVLQTWSGTAWEPSEAGVFSHDDTAVPCRYKLFKNLTVEKSGTGAGAVTSDPAGIDCGADCSEKYLLDSLVTLTAVPQANSSFMGWFKTTGGSYPNCSDNPVCAVKMDAAKTIVAKFMLNMTLTIVKNDVPGGTIYEDYIKLIPYDTINALPIDCGDTPCAKAFRYGYIAELEMKKDLPVCSVLKSIQGCTQLALPANCHVLMDSDKTVTYNFEPVKFELTASGFGNGAGILNIMPLNEACSLSSGVNCVKKPDCGSTVVLTATAAAGSHFEKWTISSQDTSSGRSYTSNHLCAAVGPNPECSFPMEYDLGQGAIFCRDNYTYSGNGTILNGVVNGSCIPNACPAPAPIKSNLCANAGTSVPTGTVNTLVDTISNCDGTKCQYYCDAAAGYEKSGDVCVLKNYDLTVEKLGNGADLVTAITATPYPVSSDTGGIACGSSCVKPYSHGTTVTLTAAAPAGTTFDGWSGDCNTSGKVTMTGAKTCKAAFTLKSYALTITKSGTGANLATAVTAAPYPVSSSDAGGIACGSTCVKSYSHGTTVTLTATAPAGTTFTGWTGACTGAGATCVVTMDAAKSVNAVFSKISYTLTVEKTGTGIGTVIDHYTTAINCGSDCSEPTYYGVKFSLTATPSTGSTFTGWSGAGCSGSGACTVTMDADKTVTALFYNKEFILTVNQAGAGSGTVTDYGDINCGSDCSVSAYYGSTDLLIAMPSASSIFTGWSGACTGTDNTCRVTMNADKTVSATFMPKPVLTVSKSGSGASAGKVTATNINCGADCLEAYSNLTTKVTLNAAPGANNSFTGWSGACTGSGDCTVTMDASKAVTANFVLTAALSVAKSGYGTVTSSPVGINCGTDCSEAFNIDNINSAIQMTLTAAPNTHNSFTHWSGAGCSGTGSCTVTMDSAKSVTANFTPEIKIFNCTPLLASVGNVAWNTVSSYTQTWNNTANSWSPADDPDTEYNTSGSAFSCRYACADGYTKVGDVCVLKNQSRLTDCGGSFNYASWTNNNGGSVQFTQNSTDGGLTWSPLAKSWSYNDVSGECNFSCNAATGYSWNGSACVINGVCGAANGISSATAPNAGSLCSYGTADIAPEIDAYSFDYDAWLCPSVINSPFASQAVKDICIGAGSPPVGVPDNVWDWTCKGQSGGVNASCSAPKKINGVCGLFNNEKVNQTDFGNAYFRCYWGKILNFAGTGPWTWTCDGTNGGAPTNCSADKY